MTVKGTRFVVANSGEVQTSNGFQCTSSETSEIREQYEVAYTDIETTIGASVEPRVSMDNEYTLADIDPDGMFVDEECDTDVEDTLADIDPDGMFVDKDADTTAAEQGLADIDMEGIFFGEEDDSAQEDTLSDKDLENMFVDKNTAEDTTDITDAVVEGTLADLEFDGFFDDQEYASREKDDSDFGGMFDNQKTRSNSSGYDFKQMKQVGLYLKLVELVCVCQVKQDFFMKSANERCWFVFFKLNMISL